ncbi:MAG: hypothetical protein CHACPFDD_03871 [Phycisphaerae bacterium]|nr:hypothetical protein [Phycisphaerae bacterium]
MRLSDVRHQERAISILRRALSSGRTHHAYLFDGPEGIGKELTARALAARLMCRAPAGLDACGGCPSCRLIAGGGHPDFVLVERGLHKLHPDPAVRRRKGLFLTVDVIRHFLIERAVLRPTQGTVRVFLIREAERMNDEAQNALLKTLEEPPGETRLLLVTAASARLLPTIRSRCQRVPFDPLPLEFVADRIVAAGETDVSAARRLARLSDGRLGLALLWRQIGLPQRATDVRRIIEQLPARGPEWFGRTLIEIAEELVKRGGREEPADADEPDAEDDAADPGEGRKTSSAGTDELRAALKLVLMLAAAALRDRLIAESGADAELLLVGGGQAASAEWGDPAACVAAVARCETMIDRNVSPQLACEWLAAACLGRAVVH